MTGQATRGLARALHGLAHAALLVLVLIVVAVTLGAWRLSQGPLELPWLAHKLATVIEADHSPARVTVGTAALAWEGFHQGVDRPLDIRLTDVTATDASGVRTLHVPQADVSLSVSALLLGRLRPRAIEIERPRVRVNRASDGAITLDLGDAATSTDTSSDDSSPQGGTDISAVANLLGELGTPAVRDNPTSSRFGDLRRVRIRDAVVHVTDRALGASWSVNASDIDLRRRPRGGVQGGADLTLRLGDQQTRILVTADQAAGGAVTEAHFTVSPVVPAKLAGAAPGLQALSALDAPVGLDLRLVFDPQLALRRASLNAQVGAGQVRIGASTLSLVAASIIASGSPSSVSLQSAKLELLGHDGGPHSTLEASGSLGRDPDKARAALQITLDRVAFADLPRLWPAGVGGGARSWIVQNVTAGTARDGHFDLALEAPTDFSSVALTGASGTLKGEELTVNWLRPVPPIDHAQALLRLVDPDTVEITTQGGRQRQEGRRDPGTGGLAIRDGRMRITGLMQKDQLSAIDATIAGTLGDAIALLKNPRLQLLSKHPIEMQDPAGQVSVNLSVQLPLEDKVKMESIGIHAQARLDDVHLGGIMGGRSLDGGALDLQADTDGMKVNGKALLAGIPAQLAVEMDFRAGPPSQVLQKISASGQANAAQLAAAGLGAGTALSGVAALEATLTERRSGDGQLDVAADLTAAELTAAPLGWRKPAGRPATGTARLRLSHDKLAGVDDIVLDGDGLSVRGRADYENGTPSLLRLDRIVLGKTEAQGSVRFPPGGGPIQATVAGATLDLSASLSREQAPTTPRSNNKEGASSPWAVEARFDRALMGKGRVVTSLMLRAENNGQVMQRLHLEGRTTPEATFRLDIAPEGGSRRLTAATKDAGGLLRAFNIVDTIQGGQLSVAGAYDDRSAEHPLSGTAEVSAFRVQGAPFLARLLKAITLYGLVDLVQGSGLGFTRLVAPFTLTSSTLDLADARAFSSSLGLTMKGRVDLAQNQANLDGTIVPAYFFNSLLGHIPLVGKLFSPEEGGGLFAAAYTVRGPLADPQVSVNPLSALTPGFLRGVFGD